MSTQISFSNNDPIKKIISHTNYTEQEAKDKLQQFNGDCLRVIRDYMGIPEKKENTKVKSLNQEIFRQIRLTLDNSMKDYRDKNPINIDQVKENFKESDEREKNRIK
jgi:hypothetical protein